jgi:hypothetical protein
MATYDPSWCARINAWRAHTEPTPGPALPLGSPYVKVEVPDRHFCELCGVEMYDHNCKIVCPNCGYKRDCSDP